MKHLRIVLTTFLALIGGCGGGGGGKEASPSVVAASTDLTQADMLAKASATANKGQLDELMSRWSLSSHRRIASTRQTACYDNVREIACPKEGEPFSGQDASYRSPRLPYLNRDDGTVIDLNTGLTWTRALRQTEFSGGA